MPKEALDVLLNKIDPKDKEALVAWVTVEEALNAGVNQIVRRCWESLTLTERDVAKTIASHNNSDEFVVKAATLSEGKNFSKSTVVTTLRKLSAAGVIRFRSMGPKGTFIKFLNPGYRDAITGM